MIQLDSFDERLQKSLDVGVAADPSIVDDANRVDGADAPRDGVDFVHALE